MVNYASDADLAAAVDYYAKLTRFYKQPVTLGGVASRAAQLVLNGKPDAGVPPCSSCHAPQLAAVFPNLHGQNPDYLYSQLEAFKHGQRVNDPIMPMNVQNLTSAELRDLAEYFYQQSASN